MPVGVIVNVLSVLIGGFIGSFTGEHIPDVLKKSLPMMFGISAMAMGICSVITVKTLPVVVLSIIAGYLIGELTDLDGLICRAAQHADRLVGCRNGLSVERQRQNMELFVTIVVLFCVSSAGIYGALISGFTGDHTILLAKSVLDFFTAIIFATSLGLLTMVVCIPQCILLLALFYSASSITPYMNEVMLSDFSACGGIIILAVGFRVSQIKPFPVANMTPALLLVMPASWLWNTFLV